MAVAIATLHPRRRLGPALRRLRVPYGGLALSALMHVSLAAIILLAGHVWRANQPKTYVVNLVPAVAAIGAPRATQPAPVLPEREPPREVERPSRPTDLPARTPPPRESVALPDRTLPSRTAALPRPGEKELPPVPSAPSTPAPTNRAVAAAPPTPVGRPTGSPQGVGALTLSAADFPFAWYLRQVQGKISERWDNQARDGGQPLVVFEILRDGKTRALAVEKSSGNSLYDQAALRAITEATPFPPLPEEFREPFLRIHLQFNYAGTRG
jgi:periplasmic protein TonB